MQIRLADPKFDVPGITEVVNAFEREPIARDTVCKWFEHMPPSRIAHRIVATDRNDQVIGYGVATHETWAPDHQFYVWVGVAPSYRGHGVGSALYEDINQFLYEQRAIRLTSEVRDDDSLSLSFSRKNGFSTDRHLFASRIDVKRFDETLYTSLIENLKDSGISFHTLADFPQSQLIKQKLYEINSITALDIPGTSGTYMSFEDFDQWVCNAEWYRPDGQIIAADKDKWIGLSAVQLMPEINGAYNLMTGVLKSYRGRKIAQALKVMALSYARSHNANYMSTDNDSLNIPMLAINKKFGYVPEPGKYNLIKTLE